MPNPTKIGGQEPSEPDPDASRHSETAEEDRSNNGRAASTSIYYGRHRLPRTVNGTGHTGPSEFCATSI